MFGLRGEFRILGQGRAADRRETGHGERRRLCLLRRRRLKQTEAAVCLHLQLLWAPAAAAETGLNKFHRNPIMGP